MDDDIGSLPVPNVQQLAASSSKDVPSRYVRDELELDLVGNDDESSVQVPVIDMSKLVMVVDGCEGDDELSKLHLACRDWGFFQVINHGVAEDVILKMKDDIREFFEQSLQEKMKYAQASNSNEGYGHSFVVSEEQKLDWSDMLFVVARPLNLRNMRFWPTVPSSFRSTMDQYSTEVGKLASSLLKFMAKNLGIEQEKMHALFGEGVQGVRINYYPPCKQTSKVVGLAPHSDGSGLTLLTQVNEVRGLQIRKDGKWVPVDPIPGAFIVNVGDIIEIMSNGEYKSIEHRVMVNHEKERLSIAAFHNPNFDAMIEPLSDVLVKDRKKQAPHYKSIPHQGFLNLAAKLKLDGKGNGVIHQVKIQTECEPLYGQI